MIKQLKLKLFVSIAQLASAAVERGHQSYPNLGSSHVVYIGNTTALATGLELCKFAKIVVREMVNDWYPSASVEGLGCK